MSTAVSQVNLNIDELKGFLTHIVNNNRFLQQGGKPSVAVEIVGESGIGKTSSALQLAHELGLNFVKLNLAQIEELGDLVGFPIRQFQLCTAAGVAIPKTIQVPVKVKKKVTQEKTVKKQVMEGGQLVTKEIIVPVQVEVEEEVMENQVITESSTGEQECLWVDEHAVDEYLKHGYTFTGEKRMSYCPPEWIANKTGGGILILDDWNRAD